MIRLRAGWSKADAVTAMKTNSAALHAALEHPSDEDLAIPMGG